MPTPLQIVLPAIVLLAITLTLSVRALRDCLSRSRGTSGFCPQMIIKEGDARVRRLERGLEDYSRAIEGRMKASAALLDQVTREFDEEIARLEMLLDESHRAHRGEPQRLTDRRLTPEQRRMICFLAMAGFRSTEIARLAMCPVEQIRRLLADDSRGANAA